MHLPRVERRFRKDRRDDRPMPEGTRSQATAVEHCGTTSSSLHARAVSLMDVDVMTSRDAWAQISSKDAYLTKSEAICLMIAV